MSGNLSFTQELRRQGLIADVKTNDTNNDNKIEKEVKNDTANKVETKVKNNAVKEVKNDTETKKVERKSFNSDNSIIYIGRKPTMNYVLAINTRMVEGLDKITLKSRGNNINKAVDVAEIVTNRFVTDANDDEVKLSTEEIFREDGTSTNVSTIEIVIQK